MADSLASSLIELVRHRLTAEYPGQLARCLEVLDEDDIWWRPNEQTNAIGNLVLHLVGSNLHFVEHVVGGRDYARDRDREFGSRGEHTKRALLTLWAETTARVARVLERLTPARLNEPTSYQGRSVAYVLMHVTHHNALHLGQIVWVTKLRKPGSLNELLRTPQAPLPTP